MAAQALEFQLALGPAHLGLAAQQLGVAGQHSARSTSRPGPQRHPPADRRAAFHLKIRRQPGPTTPAARRGPGRCAAGALGRLLGVEQLGVGLDQLVARRLAGLHPHRHLGCGSARRGPGLPGRPQFGLAAHIRKALVETRQQVVLEGPPLGLRASRPKRAAPRRASRCHGLSRRWVSARLWVLPATTPGILALLRPAMNSTSGLG
jgi:hypothetical protein